MDEMNEIEHNHDNGHEAKPLVYDIGDLDCADCAAQFEAAVGGHQDVARAELVFASAVLTVWPAGDDLAARLAANHAVSEASQAMGHPAALRGSLRPGVAPPDSPLEAADLAYDVHDLDCADCAAQFEEAVRRVSGVREATLNFAAATLSVSLSSDDPAVRDQVVRSVAEIANEMGHPVTYRTDSGSHSVADDAQPWWRRLLSRRRDLNTALAGLVIAAAFLTSLLSAPAWVTNGLYSLGIAIGGYYVARAGWFGLVRTHSLDMNALMALAAVGAMIIGEFAEGAMVILLFSVGNTLEGYTVDRARNAIRSLMSLAPKRAIKLADGQQQEVPVEQLRVGDRILVRADERVPVDGRVEQGQSAVNQAPVTGESVPVEKDMGDQVYAGTVNGEGSLIVRVTHLAEDSTIARIIHMVEQAQASKAPSQRFVDRFAKIYTPAVIGVAVVVAALPPLLGLGTWSTWIYRALVLLVISCPCALVISTPVSIVSAIASAARIGVLVKGGSYLEELGQVQVVAFDKTGTLTVGRPKVVQGRCDQHPDGDDPLQCVDYRELLAHAAAVEQHSQHPLARAVVEEAQRVGVHQPNLVAEGVQTAPGQGIRGAVNGRQIAVGKHAYIHATEPTLRSDDFCDRVEETTEEQMTTMVVADLSSGRRGILSVADQVRPQAAQVIRDLKAAGIEKTVMLTGDRTPIAQAIAQEVGIDQVYADLSPQDKLTRLRELLATHKVAMIGDGVNDAPALAQATVGIAMGAIGTDSALETADVALMADDLSKLVPTIRLGRRTLRTIRQNTVIALLIKALFLALAVAGVATLWMAVFADVGTSMIVILNAMRLLRFGDDTDETRNLESSAS